MDGADRITRYIESLPDWRGTLLGRLRRLIRAAGPDLVEEWKWSTPVWSGNANVVALGAFREHVKINFFRGAALEDPKGLFNAGLEAKTARSIDVRRGERVDEAALEQLVRDAVALDRESAGAGQRRKGR